MLRKSMSGLLLTVLCLGIAIPAARAEVNIVQNPSFDYGDAGGGPPTSAEQASGVVYAWTHTGTGNAGGYYEINTHSGDADLLFGSTNGSEDVFTQNLPTVAGDSYQISFWLSSQVGSVEANENDFSASFNGVPLFSQTNIAAQPYTQYTFTALAASSSTSLVFSGQGGAIINNSPNRLLLDDVSVTDLSDASPAPEPATWSILGLISLGLGGLLMRARKTPGQFSSSSRVNGELSN